MKSKTKKALVQLRELKKESNEMRLAAESWKNDYETLIAIILSARTRDEVTIVFAEKLFKKYPTPKKLSKAKLEDVEKIIKPINFYKTKSKNIIRCAEEIVEKYNSKIPREFEKLTSLSGVGRKTANVFLCEIGFDSIGVDTHVSYISRKLGWTKTKISKNIEEDLKKLFPQKYWSSLNYILVGFGRTFTSRTQKNNILERIRKLK